MHIAAPVFEVFPADVVVISPETAELYCEVSGIQTPNITWIRNDTTLESGTDIVISIGTLNMTRNSTLTILNTVPNDAGNYTCMAVTAAGNVSASAELTVQGTLSLYNNV